MNRRIALALAASLTTAIVIAAVAASLTDRDATPADELPLIDANPTRTDPVDFGPFVVYSDTATAVPERQLANGDADLLPPTFDFATGSLISQSVHIAADE